MIANLRPKAVLGVFCAVVAWNVHATTSRAEPNDRPGTSEMLSLFEEISQIPRCSKHEEGISRWLVQWADKRGLAVKTDEHRNVVISIPPSKGREDRPAIVLQAHMDMVCQKDSDSSHDFSKDPIALIRDGEWLRAKDTTLGADDGIGIAIALALAEGLAVSHPPLELLFTADEEVDVTGAEGLARDFFTGRRLINLDSETEGVITVGAAGGIKLDIVLPLTFAPLTEEEAILVLHIDNLLGGHSGIDINKDRANASVLLARALSTVPIRLISIFGGTADNAIARTSEAQFAVHPAQLEPLEASIAAFEQEIRREYPHEKELSILLNRSESRSAASSEADSAKVIQLIRNLPQGVQEWSTAFSGLPETSNNIGVVRVESETLKITAFARSFSPEKLEGIAQMIEAASERAGASVTRRSRYPVWPPTADSELFLRSVAVYERLFQTPMRTEVVHAGLETGYFAERQEGMEIISIGPTLENVHTPRERLYVPSLEKISRFLTELLREL